MTRVMRYRVEQRLCSSFFYGHLDSQAFSKRYPSLLMATQERPSSSTAPEFLWGRGEPPIVCMGGVIANAIFDATGIKLFDLPITAERIKKGLSGHG